MDGSFEYYTVSLLSKFRMCTLRINYTSHTDVTSFYHPYHNMNIVGMSRSLHLF